MLIVFVVGGCKFGWFNGNSLRKFSLEAPKFLDDEFLWLLSLTTAVRLEPCGIFDDVMVVGTARYKLFEGTLLIDVDGWNLLLRTFEFECIRTFYMNRRSKSNVYHVFFLLVQFIFHSYARLKCDHLAAIVYGQTIGLPCLGIWKRNKALGVMRTIV